MVYTVICDPSGDATKREFVETVESSVMADDIVKHVKAHLPAADVVRSQWGNRPFDAKREFDRSRWQERPVERDVDGKPLPL